MGLGLRNRGFVTRLLCAFALVSLAFAQPASAGTRDLSPEELAAYMLPDGSLPSLCVTLPDGSGKGTIVKLGAATLGLHIAATIPMPSCDGGVFLRVQSERLVPVTQITLRRILYPPGAGPRAPPASELTV